MTTCRQRLARIHLVEGKAQQSLEELMKALNQVPPGFPIHTLYTLMAEAHIELGEHSQATVALSTALAARPDHVPAHLTFSKMLQANVSNKISNSMLFKYRP